MELAPTSNGLWLVSGPIVEFNQGDIFVCGLAGSDLICKLAFLSDCPTVLTPTWYPASKKFWSLNTAPFLFAEVHGLQRHIEWDLRRKMGSEIFGKRREISSEGQENFDEGRENFQIVRFLDLLSNYSNYTTIGYGEKQTKMLLFPTYEKLA